MTRSFVASAGLDLRPLSIVPGAAHRTSYQALVMAPRGQSPSARLTLAPNTASIALKPAQTANEIAGELRRRGYDAWQMVIDGLKSGSTHELIVSVTGQSRSLTIHTLPDRLPAEGISLALASCFYRGFNKASSLNAAMRQPTLGGKPIMQFWGGDNLYVDVPAFGIFSGDKPVEHTVDRYLEYFTDAQYMHARSSAPNYTTYDDHEFWNNYPEPQIWLSRSRGNSREGYTRAAQQCLRLFQSSLNTAPVADGRSFRLHLEPLSFFVADTRSNRELNDGGKGLMMTQGDLAALVDWAGSLKGPGVLIIGQPVWLGTGGKTDYNLIDFKAQFKALYTALWTAPYDILVLSGDVHHSRALRLSDRGRQVLEFVSSPASHIPSVTSSILPWKKQDEGKVNVIPPRGGQTQLEYEFGTASANSIGVLRLTPRGSNAVDVGGSFLDYSGSRVRVAKLQSSAARGYSARHASCQVDRLWTLRKRGS